MGGINTAVTFGLYAILVKLGVYYNLAMTVTYFLGIVLGFLMNRLWTFSDNGSADTEPASTSITKSANTQFVQYLMVYLLVFVVNFLILNLLVQVFELGPILSQLIAVAISTVCSYALQKFWVFKHN